jgi:hypothetical protein
MGFIRQQEQRLASRLLLWQYQSKNLPIPSPSEVERQAARIVEEAHRIAAQRGRNVLDIIRERIVKGSSSPK